MSLLAARKKDWTLTKEAFERLLASLDANREHAGLNYENLRHKLIEFFEARGSSSPTDHADEAINRVARKVEEGEKVQDLNRYSYGVVRLLLRETCAPARKSQSRSTLRRFLPCGRRRTRTPVSGTRATARMP